MPITVVRCCRALQLATAVPAASAEPAARGPPDLPAAAHSRRSQYSSVTQHQGQRARASQPARRTCPPRCTLAEVAAAPRCCQPALCRTLQRRWWRRLAWRLAPSPLPDSLVVAGCLSCCAWGPRGGRWRRRCRRAGRRGLQQVRRPDERVLGVAGRLRGQVCVVAVAVAAAAVGMEAGAGDRAQGSVSTGGCDSWSCPLTGHKLLDLQLAQQLPDQLPAPRLVQAAAH